MISFLGFEWTQIDPDKENHYGHKNVMFLETDEESVPVMPIGSGGVATDGMRSVDRLPTVRSNMLSMALVDFKNRNRYADLITFSEHILKLKIAMVIFIIQIVLVIFQLNSKISLLPR